VGESTLPAGHQAQAGVRAGAREGGAISFMAAGYNRFSSSPQAPSDTSSACKPLLLCFLNLQLN